MDATAEDPIFAPFPLGSVWENTTTHVRYRVVGYSPLTLQLRVERADEPYWYPGPKPFLYNPVDIVREFERVPTT